MVNGPEQTVEGSLAGRVALITGGSSGIGRATALLFAREGASVVVADTQTRPRGGGIPTAELIETAGGNTVHVPCDVTRSGDRAAAVEAAERLGGLDILVNNAGIFQSQPFLEVGETDYDTMAGVNVKAVFFMAQTAARVMVPRRSGSIINLSSVAGLQGSGSFTSYCTSKFAVRGLTYALADELGPMGIRVNAVHPGLIATAMTTTDVPIVGAPNAATREQAIPLQRIGDVDDVARAILMLASDLAEYITGASLVVDGGRHRS